MESYWLSINGYPGRPCNDALGNMAELGWPLGRFISNGGEREGYWDFLKVTADDRGEVAVATTDLPSPTGECVAKFLVKRAYSDSALSGEVVLHNDSVMFRTGTTSGAAWWVGLSLAALVSFALAAVLLVVRRHGKSVVEEPSPALPEKRPLPFKVINERWQIGAHQYDPLRGFEYIRQILIHGQGDGLTPERLLGMSPAKDAPESQTIAPEDNLHTESFSRQPSLDKVAQDSYKRRLAQISNERVEAHSRQDWKHIEELDEEYGAIENELEGSGKDIGSEERNRVGVAKAINRALAKLESGDPEICQFLKKTIIYRKRHWQYHPEFSQAATEWDLH